MNKDYAHSMQDDTISRQAAIEAVTSWLNRACHPLNRSKYNEGEIAAYETALRELKKISSTKPDVPDTNVGDMISRQAAIDAILGCCPSDFNNEYECG